MAHILYFRQLIQMVVYFLNHYCSISARDALDCFEYFPRFDITSAQAGDKIMQGRINAGAIKGCFNIRTKCTFKSVTDILFQNDNGSPGVFKSLLDIANPGTGRKTRTPTTPALIPPARN
ncbi:MAG: hypothetical protein M0C28_25875 [Candidatus Moduliflexus flocculans]|nr:hypothetical protein [Candidatus Moduliflexus flocculans]